VIVCFAIMMTGLVGLRVSDNF